MESARRLSDKKEEPFVQTMGPLMRQGMMNPNPSRKDPLDAPLHPEEQRAGPAVDDTTAVDSIPTGRVPLQVNVDSSSDVPKNEEITLATYEAPRVQNRPSAASRSTPGQPPMLRSNVVPQVAVAAYDDRSVDNTYVGDIEDKRHGKGRLHSLPFRPHPPFIQASPKS